MKKLSRKEFFVILAYSVVTVAVISTTVLYVILKICVWHTPLNELFLFPLLMLFGAEYFGHLWWKDRSKQRRCTQYAVGKIVGRKYIHTGNVAGYTPIVRFETDQADVTVEVDIINKSFGKSVNCTIGDDYYLLYNPSDPSDFIACSSDAEQIAKYNTVLTIVFHACFLLSFGILLAAFF